MKTHEDNPDMRVLKTATCKTVTGKSTLTYQIGSLPDSTVHIRITKNTGAGFFNDEWVALQDIRRALADGPEGQPLTSFLLQSLVKGKSVNTPAFLMAALTHERLLRVLKGKKRGHEFMDPEGFTDRMDQLASSKTKPKGTARKTAGNTDGRITKKTARKTVTKKTGGNAVIKKRVAVKRKQRKIG
jgi:hypothetical protein